MAELENLSTKLTGRFLESLCVDWFTDVSHFFFFQEGHSLLRQSGTLWFSL